MRWGHHYLPRRVRRTRMKKNSINRALFSRYGPQSSLSAWGTSGMSRSLTAKSAVTAFRVFSGNGDRWGTNPQTIRAPF